MMFQDINFSKYVQLVNKESFSSIDVDGTTVAQRLMPLDFEPNEVYSNNDYFLGAHKSKFPVLNIGAIWRDFGEKCRWSIREANGSVYLHFSNHSIFARRDVNLTAIFPDWVSLTAAPVSWSPVDMFMRIILDSVASLRFIPLGSNADAYTRSGHKFDFLDTVDVIGFKLSKNTVLPNYEYNIPKSLLDIAVPLDVILSDSWGCIFTSESDTNQLAVLECSDSSTVVKTVKTGYPLLQKINLQEAFNATFDMLHELLQQHTAVTEGISFNAAIFHFLGIFYAVSPKTLDYNRLTGRLPESTIDDLIEKIDYAHKQVFAFSKFISGAVIPPRKYAKDTETSSMFEVEDSNKPASMFTRDNLQNTILKLEKFARFSSNNVRVQTETGLSPIEAKHVMVKIDSYLLDMSEISQYLSDGSYWTFNELVAGAVLQLKDDALLLKKLDPNTVSVLKKFFSTENTGFKDAVVNATAYTAV